MFGKKAAHLLPDASRTAMLFSKIEQNNKLLTRFGYRSFTMLRRSAAEIWHARPPFGRGVCGACDQFG
jgi:hypothetical protein